MQDVSTRACESILLGADREGISHKDLLEDLPLELETLLERRASISWDAFVELVERFEELSGDVDGVENAGAEWIHGASLWAYRERMSGSRTVRELFEPASPLHASIDASMFRRRLETLGDGRFRIAYRMDEGLRGSTAVFQLYAGMIRATPRLVGRPEAHVEAQITPHSGVYAVTPPRERLVARLRACFAGASGLTLRS